MRVSSTALRAPITGRLLDVDAERVRREHEAKILELQRLPAARMATVPDVRLVDAVATPIAHGLGHVPVWVAPSPPRGAASTGRIEEIRDGTHDRSQIVVLKATGWGATITIDLAVM